MIAPVFEEEVPEDVWGLALSVGVVDGTTMMVVAAPFAFVDVVDAIEPEPVPVDSGAIRGQMR